MDTFKTRFYSGVNKIASTKAWYYIENLLVIGLLMYCIKGLTDYDNMIYQTWKMQAGAKGVMAFTAIVFIIRKVKLFNWQSLLGTVLFIPFFIERMHFWRESPDIIAILRPQMLAEWLALMIIIDMIVYKDVNNLFGKLNLMLILYAVLTLGMLYRRNGQIAPVILVFPMLLFALVKMDDEKKDWFFRRFIDGWFFMFVYVCLRSFKENPFNGRRYYGYFLDIGPFGIFMVCCLVVAVFALNYSKDKYGRKSFFYIASMIWIVASSLMIWIIDTRTTWAGVLVMLAFVYLYVRKDTDKKVLRKRALKIGGFVLALIAIIVVGLIVFRNTDSPYWYGKAEKGLLSPFYMHAARFADAMAIDRDASLWHQFVEIIDRLSSGRIGIARLYKPYFNYEGNGPIGVAQTNDYWVYNTHVNFVQILVEYGWLTLIEMTTLVIMAIVVSVKRYLKGGKRILDLFPMLWLTAMIGVWCGEVSGLYYPATFFGIMFIARMLVPEGETAESQ